MENFPGFPEGIQGPELIENMRKQAMRFGAEYHMGHLAKADLSKRPIELTFGKETIQTRTLIIASGASARWLGLPSEHALIGHGVSSCATCDGFFFSGKEIAVIGGGDSAMEEATFLTRFASKVTLIHRREQFRASKIMLGPGAAPIRKSHFLTDTVVDDVLDVSKKEVTALRLRNLKTGESWDLPTSAMFLGIGHIPNAKVFEGQFDTDADGYLSHAKERHSPKFRESSPVETCRIAAIARPSPRPVRAAWLHLKWRNIWKKKATDLERHHQLLWRYAGAICNPALVLLRCRSGSKHSVVHPKQRRCSHPHSGYYPPDSVRLMRHLAEMVNQHTSKFAGGERADADG